MTSSHLTAVLISLLLYTLLGLTCFGWGKLLMLTQDKSRQVEGLPVTFTVFIGWACTLLLFQLIHLVLPLTFYAVTPVFVLGLLFSGIFFVRARKDGTAFSSLLSPAKTITIIIGMVLASAWLASRAMMAPTAYDSGLYHFPAIRWINSYAIVPGLGNLHGRLAFNQAFFPYAAALNFYPFFNNGRSIANSFLILLTTLTFIEMLIPIIKRPRLALQLSPMQWLPPLLGLPILAFWSLSSVGVASPSLDLPSSLLQLVIFVQFVRSLDTFAKKRTIAPNIPLFLSILIATAITVKLSNLVFGAVVMVLLFIGVFTISENKLQEAMRLLLPAGLIVLLFCVRGIVLSGAPLYPSTIGYIQTEWSVPVDKVIDEANKVYYWARQPNTHWSNVIGRWDWIVPWMERVQRRETIRVVYPVGAFLALSLLGIVTGTVLKPREIKKLSLYWLLFLPLFAGLAFWFFTAPDPRFANALFLLMPIAISLLLVVYAQNQVSGRLYLAIICALFLVSNFNLIYWTYQNQSAFTDVSRHGWQEIRSVPLKENITKTGLLIYTPANRDQCWDAPLPCTPFWNENLQLRRPSDLSSGFMVDMPEAKVEEAETLSSSE